MGAAGASWSRLGAAGASWAAAKKPQTSTAAAAVAATTAHKFNTHNHRWQTEGTGRGNMKTEVDSTKGEATAGEEQPSRYCFGGADLVRSACESH